MTEQPEPTEAIDMTKVLADAQEDSETRQGDAVEGEPGWEKSSSDDRAEPPPIS